VGDRTGLDDMEKRKFMSLSGLELRRLGRRARSQLLYRQRYPGSADLMGTKLILVTKIEIETGIF
jgi:hypothetical protein